MPDPTYTYSVPKFQMVSGGFDILSNIMEIYFSGPDEEIACAGIDALEDFIHETGLPAILEESGVNEAWT